MFNVLGVVLVDLGIAAVVVAFVSLVKPLRFLGVRSRRAAFALIPISLAIIVAGMLLPAPLQQAAEVRTELDRAMPTWQFSEYHETKVNAPPERVYRAIKEVTADDIRLFRTLTWIRRFGQPLPEGILNPAGRPILDVATTTSFVYLADGPQEIVVGTAVVAPREARRSGRLPTAEEYLALRARDGFALATMNFTVTSANDGGCDVTTETRVFGTDRRTARAFAAYWRVIYPGSSLIRYMWLRAIKSRAEA